MILFDIGIALKNPLFFFKEVLFDLKLSEQEFFNQLSKKNYIFEFLNILLFVTEGQKNDFKIRDKGKQYSMILTEE